MKKILNKIDVKYYYLLFFVPFLIYVIKPIMIGIDIHYMIPAGKYVLNNGFPYVDPFTIHEGLKYVMQQWSSNIIYYLIDSNFGSNGLIIFNLAIMVLLLFALYKLCLLVSNNNKKVSIIISSIIMSLLSRFGYIDVRPQMFTFLFLVLFIYVIEKYLKTRNRKILLFLPLISLLQINFHASMWWFLFIISLPFTIEIIYNVLFKKKNSLNDMNYLILALIMSFFVGLINPYGMDAITYLFNSLDETINNYISEMFRPHVFSKTYICVIILLFISFIIYLRYYKKNNKIRISYLLLLFGTFILANCNLKSISLYFIFGIYPISYYLSNIKYNQELKNNVSIFQVIIMIIIVVFIIFKIIVNTYEFKFLQYGKTVANYLSQSYDLSKIRIYTSYNLGPIMEYYGMKPYIDTRSELFLEKLNKKEDILKEYVKVENGKINIDDFLEKYQFTHIFADEYSIFYEQENIKNYNLLMETEDYKLYEKNN